MKVENKIIIHAEPEDVSKALIQMNNIGEDYELKEFTYKLVRLDPSHIDPMMKEYKITLCELVLIKKSNALHSQGKEKE